MGNGLRVIGFQFNPLGVNGFGFTPEPNYPKEEKEAAAAASLCGPAGQLRWPAAPDGRPAAAQAEGARR